MRSLISGLLLSFLRAAKADPLRFQILKMLFKRNAQVLKGFKSFYNDRFFIYYLDGRYLPSQTLDWSCNYKYFEQWAEATALFDYKLNKGDIIVDLGAGLGEEVIVAADRVGDNGKIYAIEANPKVANVLNEVVQLNKYSHVEVHNVAVYKINSELFLEEEGCSYAANTIKEDAPDTNSYKVKGIRLDTFLEQNNIRRIDLLKANIEGAERYIVDSLGREHLKRIKRVAISCHDFRYEVDSNEFYRTKSYISDFLISNGFELRFQQSGVKHIDDYIYGTNKLFEEVANDKRTNDIN